MRQQKKANAKEGDDIFRHTIMEATRSTGGKRKLSEAEDVEFR